MKTVVIGIIGAGASGMAAALAASENPNVQVILMERQARVGKKLSATGNGRCNLSNLHASASGYYGEEPQFAEPAIRSFGVENTLRWFRDLGLHTVWEESGRVYPYSDQANSVVDVLRFALNRPNISLCTGFEVQSIKREHGRFLVKGQDDVISCDRLIVASGGLAGTKLGGSMSGYKLLRSMGHSATKLRPALVQLCSEWSGCASLKGVRANCHAAVLCDGRLHRQSAGEIQFTEYGLSGPVIFEVSRDACFGGGDWTCRLDFLPDLTMEELFTELNRRRETGWNGEDLFIGILHNRLGRILTQWAGIKAMDKLCDLREDQILAACRGAKEFEISLREPMGMDSAQVTAGGIVTREFDPETMESKLVPGLYACGEVLDIDGDCGGYNLQWAWSSGRLAGCSAGETL